MNSAKLFPLPSDREPSNMTSLSGTCAEVKSGSSSNGLIAGRDDLKLDGQSRRQLGRIIARLIKDNKLDMDDIQIGLNEIQETERMEREALVQAVGRLPADKARRIIIEFCEKNIVVRQWIARYGAPLMTESGTENKLLHMAYGKWIEECDGLYLHILIIQLIVENGFIEESLKKKLLVEQEDGTFAIRKPELDTI